MEQRRKNLTQLFIPICLETLLYMLSGMVDTPVSYTHLTLPTN